MIKNKMTFKQILLRYPKIKWQLGIILTLVLLITFHLLEEKWKMERENPLILRENLNNLGSIIFNSQGKDPFSLERRSDNSWSLVSYDVLYPSDSNLIKYFLSTLEEYKGTPISEEENSYSINTIPSLIFYNENKEEKEAFFLGERNTAKREIYLKRKSDNKIFLAPDIFSLILVKGKENFIENKIFPELNSLEPISLEVELYQPLRDFPNLQEKQRIIFNKTKEGWKSNLGALPLSADFKNINNWRAAEILAALPVEYENPYLSSEILWANGEKRKINFYDKKDNYLLLSIDNGPYAYWIDQAFLYQFLQFEE